MTHATHDLYVELGDRRYPITIGADLLNDFDALSAVIQSQQVVVVTNETIAPLYLERLSAVLSGKQKVTSIVLPDGEQFKTLDTLTLIFDRVLADQHNRNTTFVALGGGVVGDITGFAAACYQRGAGFVQIPTTLLAQVDSSVGGKTAVNHPAGKNMIGAFYQPSAVLIDTSTLNSLSNRDFAAGFAEVVKYGLIADAEFYEWISHNRAQLLQRDSDALAQAIRRSCEIKARIVASDEREAGVRALLNLGHTFGHAIEAFLGFGQWLHGEAVAAGMVLAMRLSCARGAVSQSQVEHLEALLQDFGLPVAAPPSMACKEFVSLMTLDKKVIDGQMRFILLDQLGSARVVDDVTVDELQRLLDDR